MFNIYFLFIFQGTANKANKNKRKKKKKKAARQKRREEAKKKDDDATASGQDDGKKSSDKENEKEVEIEWVCHFILFFLYIFRSLNEFLLHECGSCYNCNDFYIIQKYSCIVPLFGDYRT